jgi:hypothetical protein
MEENDNLTSIFDVGCAGQVSNDGWQLHLSVKKCVADARVSKTKQLEQVERITQVESKPISKAKNLYLLFSFFHLRSKLLLSQIITRLTAAYHLQQLGTFGRG